MTNAADNPPVVKKRRCWWQFGLRSLLLLVLLVAVALFFCREYLKPYWRQQQTVALVEKLRGSCQTTEVRSHWLRWLGCTHNVTRVEMDGGDPNDYIAAVAELPAVELLIVGGLAFTDEHAKRLHRMRSLRGIILESTSVNEEELTLLREALPDAEVYAGQQQAIGALWKVGKFPPSKLLTIPSGGSQPPSRSTSPLHKLVGDEWFHEETTFEATYHGFDDFDAAQLSAIRTMRSLSLSHTQVTDAGVAHLQGLKHLEVLDLRGTLVTDAGLESLTGLSRLHALYLDGSRVTPAGIARLQATLPKCRIYGPEE